MSYLSGPSPRGALLSLIALSVVCLSCHDAPLSGREAWLTDTLIEDHWHLIQRDPSLVEGKLLKMSGRSLDGAQSAYPFLRGTLPP